ncbi:MAG: ABC-F family ATP-binding cassette domain-containing protein [Clostridia bacterium]|nr:ABC-F family ATP-binding cassette domain-containing protein [Clostridia bacterium]
MLQIQHLSIHHNKDLTPLVTDLSFSLREGERAALIGEEGNGKSTILRLLAGLDAPYVSYEGTISVTGARGYLPQELPADEREMSAYEFFSASPAFFDQTPRELIDLARQAALPQDVFYSEQTMSSFSGGERVKLQLTRILMEKPSLLLLDEPSNDLDLSTVRWLRGFIASCRIPTVFVSHDEELLDAAANVIIHIERLRRRQVPRATVWRMRYEEFVSTRASSMAHQEQVARKEREEFDKKMRRYDQIRQKVEHQQNTISRQDPHGGRLLKKKMAAVTSMGRRFEREAEDMTDMPESEEAIFAKLDCEPLPPGKVVLDMTLPELTVPGRVLARDLRLVVRGRDRLLLAGRNGAGKSTLLRAIHEEIRDRADLRVFYMPQDPCDMLDMDKTPVEMLAVTWDKDETTRSRIALGSMKFTPEEMEHPCRGLSGGQKAKLMFLMMANASANVLLLDEPTRNISPLSGPVIRALFAEYPGCIIAVSHDERFAREVCTRAVELGKDGLKEITNALMTH